LVRAWDLQGGEERFPFVGNVVPDLLDPNDFFRLQQAAAFCESFAGYFGPVGGGHLLNKDWRDLECRIQRALESGEIALISEDVRQGALNQLASTAGSSGASFGKVGDESPGGAASDGTAKIHWIEFQVVDVTTGNPVPGLQLEVILADASKQKCKTNQDGSIRFDDTTPGTCMLLSNFTEVRLEDAYSFVAVE